MQRLGTELLSSTCGNDYPFSKTMLLTGLTDTRGAFEQELNSSQWTVYLPQENRVIDLLQGSSYRISSFYSNIYRAILYSSYNVLP